MRRGFFFYKPSPKPTPTFGQELESLADDLAKVAYAWFAPGPAQLNDLSARASELADRFRTENQAETA